MSAADDRVVALREVSIPPAAEGSIVIQVCRVFTAAVIIIAPALCLFSQDGKVKNPVGHVLNIVVPVVLFDALNIAFLFFTENVCHTHTAGNYGPVLVHLCNL